MTDPSPPPVESISPPDLRESSLSSSPHEQNEGEFAEDPPVRRQTTARKLYSYTWSNRKNEQARFKSLMNDPFLLPGSLNPHNAHCIACRQLVNLGTKRPYQTSMWIKHRDSCAQVKALRDQGFGQRPTDQNGGGNGSQDMITPPKEWERYTSTFQVDIGSGQPEPAPTRVTIQSQPHTLHEPPLHFYSDSDDEEDRGMDSDGSSDESDYSRRNMPSESLTTLRPAVFNDVPNPVRPRTSSHPSPWHPATLPPSPAPPPLPRPVDIAPREPPETPPSYAPRIEPVRRPPPPPPGHTSIHAHSSQSFMWRGGKSTASERLTSTPPEDAWDTAKANTNANAVAMNNGFTGGSPLAHAVESARRMKHSRAPSRSQHPSQSPRMAIASRPRLYVDTGNESSSSLLHQPMNPPSYIRSATLHRTQYSQPRHEASDEAAHKRFARNVENFRRARNETVDTIQRLQANIQGIDFRARTSALPSPAADRAARHHRSSRNAPSSAVISIPQADSQYPYHPSQPSQFYAPQAHQSRHPGYPPSPPSSLSALSTPPGEETRALQEELENKLDRAHVLAISCRGHYSNFAKVAVGILQQSLIPELKSNGTAGMDMDLGSDVGETPLDVALGSAISLASRITEGGRNVRFGENLKSVFRRIHTLVLPA